MITLYKIPKSQHTEQCEEELTFFDNSICKKPKPTQSGDRTGWPTSLSAKNILKDIFFQITRLFMVMCNGHKILHLFLYNPMIKESGWITQSIHKSRKGAEEALEHHKAEVLKEDLNTENIIIQDWAIVEFELLD